MPNNTFEKEFVSRKRIHYFFQASCSAGESHYFCEYVGYDKVTGLPYLFIEDTYTSGHSLIDDVHGRRITYEQVALYAKKYAPDSELVNINDSNFKNFIELVSESEFENPDIDLSNDKYILLRVTLLHKIVNGVRFPYQCITENE